MSCLSFRPILAALLIAGVLACPVFARAQTAPAAVEIGSQAQRGHASYYSRSLAGRRMADGTTLDPDSDSAASKTLPLGTIAKITNLRNGRSAVVRIRDRGPHVRGRIVDVSPRIAKDLGMTRHGVAPVEVKAIAPPQANGGPKPGNEPG